MCTEVPVAVTLHERLRSATRRLHLEAERALDVERSFASRSAYAGLLATLYALHEAYERALATLDLSTVGIDLVVRRRAHWLADDLASLDQKLPEPATLAHRPESIEAALGALYVLEGSNLGGRILLRTATQLPGITTARGARFFSGYGERTQAMWNDLVQTLNSLPAHGDAAARVEAAATDTFHQFIGAFAARGGGPAVVLGS